MKIFLIFQCGILKQKVIKGHFIKKTKVILRKKLPNEKENFREQKLCLQYTSTNCSKWSKKTFLWSDAVWNKASFWHNHQLKMWFSPICTECRYDVKIM